MENFTPISSAFGGVLIGLAAALLLFGLGRIAGISGILGGALSAKPGDLAWRAAFLVGLVAGGATMNALYPELFTVAASATRSLPVVVAAGLIVGFGTRMGSGCTSGHGVCGISRGSPRSLAATVTFMLTGGATVFLAGHVFGGPS